MKVCLHSGYLHINGLAPEWVLICLLKDDIKTNYFLQTWLENNKKVVVNFQPFVHFVLCHIVFGILDIFVKLLVVHGLGALLFSCCLSRCDNGLIWRCKCLLRGCMLDLYFRLHFLNLKRSGIKFNLWVWHRIFI